MFKTNLGISFILLIILVVNCNSQTTDGSDNDEMFPWHFGFMIGAAGPFLTGESSRLLVSTGDLDYGVCAGYKNLFIRFNIANIETEVKKEFFFVEKWPEKLPLDLIQYFWAVGYKIKISKDFSVDPMAHIVALNYKTDERVKEFTNIDRKVKSSYYGISVALKHNLFPGGLDVISGEIMVGLSKPINKKEILSEYLINFSAGIIIQLYINKK